jgi:ABC-type cobalamin/Fe3+-siderophores transport system ATPase subunit
MLLGHNDCRKTTLLEILSGVCVSSSGSVRPNRVDIHRFPVRLPSQRIISDSSAEVLTEENLSRSYDMPVEVIYNEQQVARAVVPRRNGFGAEHNIAEPL